MQTLTEQKKALRKRINAVLKALPKEYRAEASERIQEQVLCSEAYRNAESIFLYLAMPTEPDTRGILTRAIEDGKQVYVPKCISKTEMLAVRLRSTEQLKTGMYGILEPVDCSETLGDKTPDLILVPCVSASADGRRLGHGAGYYDRFLKGNEQRTVCLCFARALFDDIPMDENDVYMHRVVSD